MDTNTAILVGIAIFCAAHVLATLIEKLLPYRLDTADPNDAAVVASVTLKRMADQYPPGTVIVVRVGEVTTQAQTPEPNPADDGEEWKYC